MHCSSGLCVLRAFAVSFRKFTAKARRTQRAECTEKELVPFFFGDYQEWGMQDFSTGM